MHPKPAPETVTVFLIEDDDLDAEAIERAFHRAKLANPIIRARNGRDALKMLSEGAVPQPCVLLLDINMPRMNGHAFLEALRADERFSKLVVFILTTSRNDEDKCKAYRQHVAGYMVKDEVGEEFVRMICMLDYYCSVVHLPAKEPTEI